MAKYFQHSFEPRIATELKGVLPRGTHKDAAVVLHQCFQENKIYLTEGKPPEIGWKYHRFSNGLIEYFDGYFDDSFEKTLAAMANAKLIEYKPDEEGFVVWITDECAKIIRAAIAVV